MKSASLPTFTGLPPQAHTFRRWWWFGRDATLRYPHALPTPHPFRDGYHVHLPRTWRRYAQIGVLRMRFAGCAVLCYLPLPYIASASGSAGRTKTQSINRQLTGLRTGFALMRGARLRRRCA